MSVHYDQAVWSDEFDGTGSPDSSKWELKRVSYAIKSYSGINQTMPFRKTVTWLLKDDLKNRPNPNYVRVPLLENQQRVHRIHLFEYPYQRPLRLVYGRLVVRASYQLYLVSNMDTWGGLSVVNPMARLT